MTVVRGLQHEMKVKSSVILVHLRVEHFFLRLVTQWDSQVHLSLVCFRYFIGQIVLARPHREARLLILSRENQVEELLRRQEGQPYVELHWLFIEHHGSVFWFLWLLLCSLLLCHTSNVQTAGSIFKIRGALSGSSRHLLLGVELFGRCVCGFLAGSKAKDLLHCDI